MTRPPSPLIGNAAPHRWWNRLAHAGRAGLRLPSAVKSTILSAGPGWSGAPGNHFDGRRFFNPGIAEDATSFRELLKWKLNGQAARWPVTVANGHAPELPMELRTGQAAVTFVNHATFLIQLPGLNLLTDPVWSDRVSPVGWAGPKRIRPPGLVWDELPRIDAVLLSHNHYDHWDTPTLRRLHERFRPQFISGLGNAAFLEHLGIPDGEDLDWWQTSGKVSEARIVFCPARHWSNRGGGNRNTTLWGSFYIQQDHQKIYFGGDTGWHGHFQEIRQKLGSPSLALLPIGAYEPRWFMASMHMNPAEAVQAHLALGAERSMGMHYGTWQLTDEGLDDPVNDLKAACNAQGLPDGVFSPASHGKTVLADW